MARQRNLDGSLPHISGITSAVLRLLYELLLSVQGAIINASAGYYYSEEKIRDWNPSLDFVQCWFLDPR